MSTRARSLVRSMLSISTSPRGSTMQGSRGCGPLAIWRTSKGPRGSPRLSTASLAPVPSSPSSSLVVSLLQTASFSGPFTFFRDYISNTVHFLQTCEHIPALRLSRLPQLCLLLFLSTFDKPSNCVCQRNPPFAYFSREIDFHFFLFFFISSHCFELDVRIHSFEREICKSKLDTGNPSTINTLI